MKIYLSNPRRPNRWSRPVPVAQIERAARVVTTASPEGINPMLAQGVVLVAGTLDTKGEELRYIADLIRATGLTVWMVDLSTGGQPAQADISADQIAAFHPQGAAGVFTGDRGTSVAGMTLAFSRWMAQAQGVAGVIGAGGSGGTALVAPAMRVLPVGVPKLIVSTVASGEVSKYVGASDITMMHSVADVQGLNIITRDVLANAAHAMAGMVQARKVAPRHDSRPAIGLTMFGVTTPAVSQVTAMLRGDYDCLVFHATGIGGQSMEKLIDGASVMGVIDLTTTEVADMMVGGVFPATEDRFGAVIRTRMPYVGSVGALDMVNFGAPETMPDKFRGRLLYPHNPHVTLMRTTVAENILIGHWIGARLNAMEGPVRFFLPEGGVSALDAPGKPFHDTAAREALYRAIEETVHQTAMRQVIRLAHHINDPAFAAAVVAAFRALHGLPTPRQKEPRR